jgi:hypothetical protein
MAALTSNDELRLLEILFAAAASPDASGYCDAYEEFLAWAISFYSPDVVDALLMWAVCGADEASPAGRAALLWSAGSGERALLEVLLRAVETYGSTDKTDPVDVYGEVHTVLTRTPGENSLLRLFQPAVSLVGLVQLEAGEITGLALFG